MRTDALIESLVADNRTAPPLSAGRIGIAVAFGFLASLAVFVVTLGPREDALAAMESARFVLKFAVTLSASAGGLLLVAKLRRPDSRLGLWPLVLITPIGLLGAGVLAEFVAAPPSAWAALAIGSNWLQCVVIVPALSAAPLAALLVVLRHGATTRPALAGALAGLVAAGLAATLYGSYCSDDSPLFVAIWYPLAAAPISVAGALLGMRLLRW